MGKLLLLFLLFNSCFLYAQPGTIRLNLNNLTARDIAWVKTSHSSSHYEIIIDSTTDLANFEKIKFFHKLTLIVCVKVLPKEISLLSDSLQDITVRRDDMRNGEMRGDIIPTNLFDVSVLNKLKNLRSVNLEYYTGFELPEFNNLRKLKSLVIRGADQLKDLNSLSTCKSIKTLELQGLKLEIIDFQKLSKLDLVTLSLDEDRNLKSLRGLDKCRSLKSLYIEDSNNSKKKLDFDLGSMNLEELSLEYIQNLNDISKISESKSLKKLYIGNLPSLKKWDFDMSKMNLNIVSLSYTPVKNIDGILNCRSIKEIDLMGLDSLKTINFVKNNNLQVIEIRSLPKLENIDITNSTLLKNFTLTDNDQLIKISEIQQLLYIKYINIRRNKSLVVPDRFKKNEDNRYIGN
ncbi:leucine-rich repeat domain-containing protein [Mucilaginibacter sp.]